MTAALPVYPQEHMLTKEDDTYEEKETDLASIVINILFEITPGTDSKIEVGDVDTPLIYEH